MTIESKLQELFIPHTHFTPAHSTPKIPLLPPYNPQFWKFLDNFKWVISKPHNEPPYQISWQLNQNFKRYLYHIQILHPQILLIKSPLYPPYNPQFWRFWDNFKRVTSNADNEPPDQIPWKLSQNFKRNFYLVQILPYPQNPPFTPL